MLKSGFHRLRSGCAGALAEVAFLCCRPRLKPCQVSAAVLTVSPSPHLQDCLASLERQSLRPAAVHVVRDVDPFSRASQQALERVTTKYYVPVDDDMVLNRDCLERLCFLVSRDDRIGEAVLRLRDPILGIIAGVRIYQTEAVRSIGFHLGEEKGCERQMTSDLARKGFRSVLSDWVGGLHHPVYFPHEAYWKYKFIGEKLRYYGRGTDEFWRHVDCIMAFRRRDAAGVTLYCLAGLLEGLQGEVSAAELSYAGREDWPAFLRLSSFLNGTAPPPTGQD